MQIFAIIINEKTASDSNYSSGIRGVNEYF